MRIAMLLLATAFCVTTPAWSQQGDVAPPGYDDPGMKPENVLPDILTDLKRTMNDPYSIRDFAMCEPEVTKAFRYPGAGNRWEKSHWSVKLVLNAKNKFGGYAGLTYFSAEYREGKLERLGSANLGADLNRKLVDLVKSCPRIPDAEIQKLLTS